MSADDAWSCTACTFENPSTARACEICGTPNPTLESEAADVPSFTNSTDWTCEACTYAGNGQFARACTVCGTARASAPPPLPSPLLHTSKAEDHTGEKRPEEEVDMDLPSLASLVDPLSPLGPLYTRPTNQTNTTECRATDSDERLMLSMLHLLQSNKSAPLQQLAMDILVGLIPQTGLQISSQVLQSLATLLYFRLSHASNGGDAATEMLLGQVVCALQKCSPSHAVEISQMFAKCGVLHVASDAPASIPSCISLLEVCADALPCSDTPPANDRLLKLMADSLSAADRSVSASEFSELSAPSCFELVQSGVLHAIAKAAATNRIADAAASATILRNAYSREGDFESVLQDCLAHHLSDAPGDRDDRRQAADIVLPLYFSTSVPLVALLHWLTTSESSWTPPTAHAELSSIKSSLFGSLNATIFPPSISIPHSATLVDVQECVGAHLRSSAAGVTAMIDKCISTLSAAPTAPSEYKSKPKKKPYTYGPRTTACPACALAPWSCGGCSCDATGNTCEVCGSPRPATQYTHADLTSHYAAEHAELTDAELLCPSCDVFVEAAGFTEHFAMHATPSAPTRDDTSDINNAFSIPDVTAHLERARDIMYAAKRAVEGESSDGILPTSAHGLPIFQFATLPTPPAATAIEAATAYRPPSPPRETKLLRSASADRESAGKSYAQWKLSADDAATAIANNTSSSTNAAVLREYLQRKASRKDVPRPEIMEADFSATTTGATTNTEGSGRDASARRAPYRRNNNNMMYLHPVDPINHLLSERGSIPPSFGPSRSSRPAANNNNNNNNNADPRSQLRVSPLHMPAHMLKPKVLADIADVCVVGDDSSDTTATATTTATTVRLPADVMMMNSSPGLIRADSEGGPHPVLSHYRGVGGGVSSYYGGIGFGMYASPDVFAVPDGVLPSRSQSSSRALLDELVALKEYVHSLQPLRGGWLAFAAPAADIVHPLWGPALLGNSVVERMGHSSLRVDDVAVCVGDLSNKFESRCVLYRTNAEAWNAALQWSNPQCNEYLRRVSCAPDAAVASIPLATGSSQQPSIMRILSLCGAEASLAATICQRWIDPLLEVGPSAAQLAAFAVLPGLRVSPIVQRVFAMLSEPWFLKGTSLSYRRRVFQRLAFGIAAASRSSQAQLLAAGAASHKLKVVVSRGSLWHSLQKMLGLDCDGDDAHHHHDGTAAAAAAVFTAPPLAAVAAQLSGVLPGSGSADLSVQFSHEAGHGLGPTLEFFTLASNTFKTMDQPLWYNSVDKGALLHPNPASTRNNAQLLKSFELMGRLISLALAQDKWLDLPLSKAFIRAIIHNGAGSSDVVPDDLRECSPGVFASVTSLRSIQQRRDGLLRTIASSSCTAADVSALLGLMEEVSSLCLEPEFLGWTAEACNITVAVAADVKEAIASALPHLGEHKSRLHEQVANSQHHITLFNVECYVQLVLEVLLGRGIASAAAAVRRGLCCYAPTCAAFLQLFSVDEWQNMLCGSVEEHDQSCWEVSAILAAVQPQHGYSVSSAQVQHLAELLHDFNTEQRRLFMRFVTGSPRFPVGGLAGLVPRLSVAKRVTEAHEHPDVILPTCSTCTVYLKLPAYSSKGILAEKLVLAMTEGQGTFAFD